MSAAPSAMPAPTRDRADVPDGYTPEADAWSGPDGGGLRVLTPARVRAWFSLPTDATRFRW